MRLRVRAWVSPEIPPPAFGLAGGSSSLRALASARRYARGVPEELSAAVAAEVRRLCAELGWSGRELARRIGLSPNTAAAKLRGEYPFTFDDVDAIARAADVDPAEIVARAQSARASASQPGE